MSADGLERPADEAGGRKPEITPRPIAPRKLPRWVYGGAFGCAIIIAWMGWNKYRPATAEEQQALAEALGGPAGLACLQQPNAVYVVPIGPKHGVKQPKSIDDYEAVGEPRQLSARDVEFWKQILTAPRSYDPAALMNCTPAPVCRLRFVAAEGYREIWISLDCPAVIFSRKAAPPTVLPTYPLVREELRRNTETLFSHDRAAN